MDQVKSKDATWKKQWDYCVRVFDPDFVEYGELGFYEWELEAIPIEGLVREWLKA